MRRTPWTLSFALFLSAALLTAECVNIIGVLALCNIAQVAEDRIPQSDPGARCIPQGEMLGELRQSESWLARRTGIDKFRGDRCLIEPFPRSPVLDRETKCWKSRITSGLPTIRSVGTARAGGICAGLVEFLQRLGI
jgi:hypothetical protein